MILSMFSCACWLHVYVFFSLLSTFKLGYLSFYYYFFNWVYYYYLSFYHLIIWFYSSYILGRSSLSDTWYAHIFSQSMSSLFTVLIMSLHKFLMLTETSLSVFSFITYVFGIESKESLPNPSHEVLFLLFFSQSLL